MFNLGNLTGIIALPGMGKTLFMTALAYDSHNSGRKVSANYNLIFPYTHIEFQDVVENTDKVKDCDRFIDEIGEIADAYDFHMDFVRDISKTIRQGRKDDARTVYTIQDYWILPPRLRRATTTIFEPYDLDWQAFDHTRPENFGRCAMKFLISEFTTGYGDLKSRFVFDGDPYKNLYNSKQRIATYVSPTAPKKKQRVLIADE